MIMEMDLRKRRLIIAGLVQVVGRRRFHRRDAEALRRSKRDGQSAAPINTDHTFLTNVVFLRVSASLR
jgi:hypothetical protein